MTGDGRDIAPSIRAMLAIGLLGRDTPRKARTRRSWDTVQRRWPLAEELELTISRL